MTTNRAAAILRRQGDPEPPTFLELFFDVVFIFTFARISQVLAADLGIENALRAVVLLGAAWWVWTLTTWLTDLFDPRRPAIQFMVLLLMLGSLILAISVPAAFGDDGLMFVAAYLGMVYVRGEFLLYFIRGHPAGARSRRILFWYLITGPAWLAGAFTAGTVRLAIWAGALAVDYAIARLGWPTPKLGVTSMTERALTGTHLFERHRQIFIISLGELILAAGLEYAGGRFDDGRTLAFTIAFGNAVLLFMIYFRQARVLFSAPALAAIERINHAIETSYTHLLMVSGVVAVAVGNVLVIDRPFGPTPAGVLAVIVGGPVLFLTGACLFHRTATGRVLRSRLIAAAVLIAAAPAIGLLPPVAAVAASTAALLGTLIAEPLLGEEDPRPAEAG